MNKKISFPIAMIIIVVCTVLVGGIVVHQYREILKEEETPEEIPTDETADWKTYRNEEYGFEVKYPPKWDMVIWPFPPELPRKCYFCAPFPKEVSYQEGADPFLISWSKAIENESDYGPAKRVIELLIHTTIKPDKLSNQILGDTCSYWYETGTGILETEIGRQNAIRCKSPTGPGGVDFMWLIRDGKGWAFAMSGFYNEELKETAESILSTFRFID